MEALESQHFHVDINSFPFLSKEHDIYNSFSSGIKSQSLETEVEESTQLNIQMLDYTCDYPGNLLPNLE